MKLNVNGDDLDIIVSEKIIEDKLKSLSTKDDSSFLILSKNEMSYIQTSGDFEAGFILEYQENDLDFHYSCVTQPLTNVQVVKAFKDYFNQNNKWKTELSWERESLAPVNSTKLVPILVFIILVIAGVIWLTNT